MVQHQSKLTGIYSCQTALQSTHLKHSFEHFSHGFICTYHTIDEIYGYYMCVFQFRTIYMYICTSILERTSSYRPSAGLSMSRSDHMQSLYIWDSQRESRLWIKFAIMVISTVAIMVIYMQSIFSKIFIYHCLSLLPLQGGFIC